MCLRNHIQPWVRLHGEENSVTSFEGHFMKRPSLKHILDERENVKGERLEQDIMDNNY